MATLRHDAPQLLAGVAVAAEQQLGSFEVRDFLHSGLQPIPIPQPFPERQPETPTFTPTFTRT